MERDRKKRVPESKPDKPKMNPAMEQFMSAHPIHPAPSPPIFFCSSPDWAGPSNAPRVSLAAQPQCIVCESPMREVKGKWACVDVGCAMYGREQRCRP